MSDVLNPAVVNDVCPDCGAEAHDPTPCVVLEPQTPSLDLPPDDCKICDEPIVPGAAPIPDVTGQQFCKSPDPAYNFIMGISPRGGEAFLMHYIDPGCSRVLKGCNHCQELCSDADVLDKYSERKAGDNIYNWSADGAVMPLKFYVDPTYKDRVNTEYGWVIVGWHNGYNEWYPANQIKNHLYPSFDKPWDYAQGDLNNYGAILGDGIGNIPYIQEEVQVAPKAIDDESSGAVDANQVVDVTTNDFDINGDLDPTTVVLIDPSDGSEQASVVVSGEGAYTSNGDGTVTFAPEVGVTGTFTIDYKVSDTDGNQSSAATVTFTIA